MRNVALVVLAVVVCVLWFSLRSQSVAIKTLQRSLNNANEAAASASKAEASASLELQGKCARQALEWFKAMGWDKERFAVFTDHYSPKLNKCFVEVENTSVDYGVPMNSKIVADAFEGKLYGSYVWDNPRGKKYWEVPPTICRVTLSSGEEKQCRSSEEFDELAKQYMQ